MDNFDEEDFLVSVSSPSDAEFDTAVGYLEDIIMDDEFQLLQRSFMDKYYCEFEDTEENKLVYTPIFNEYAARYDTRSFEEIIKIGLWVAVKFGDFFCHHLPKYPLNGLIVNEGNIEDEVTAVMNSCHFQLNKLDRIFPFLVEKERAVLFQKIQNAVIELKNSKKYKKIQNAVIELKNSKKYKISLVEKYIENQLMERIPGFNMTAFTASLQSHKEEMSGDIFDMLITFTDFLAFKEMFIDYRAKIQNAVAELKNSKKYKEKEGRSLDLSSGLVVTSLCRATPPSSRNMLKQ